MCPDSSGGWWGAGGGGRAAGGVGAWSPGPDVGNTGHGQWAGDGFPFVLNDDAVEHCGALHSGGGGRARGVAPEPCPTSLVVGSGGGTTVAGLLGACGSPTPVLLQYDQKQMIRRMSTLSRSLLCEEVRPAMRMVHEGGAPQADTRGLTQEGQGK